MGNKLIECVPNYSEGRDLEKIEKIVECFRAKKRRAASGLPDRPQPQPPGGHCDR